MLRQTAAFRLWFATLAALTIASATSAARLPQAQTKPSPGVVQQKPSLQVLQLCRRQVPDLSPYTLEQARAVLAKYQLALGDVVAQPASAPKGTIIGQPTKPGLQVRCGTSIALIVSSGPRQDDVQAQTPPPCQAPDLTGQLLDDVQSPVRRRQPSIGTVERIQSAGRPGTIVKQSIRAGAAMKCGSLIDVAIAVPIDRPAPPCSVPHVVGRDLERAVATVNAAGLGVGAVVRRLSKDRPHTVVAQSMQAGAPMPCGSRVDLAIAVPPDVTPPPAVKYCQVPEMLGVDIVLARRYLAAANLQEGVMDAAESDRPRGTVILQSLQPGSQVRCGLPVNLRVSAGRATCTVPNVEAGDVAGARRMLAQRSLLLGTIGRRNSERAPGTILEQNPVAQTEVTCRTAVDVWVAVPMPLVSVPSLQGQDVAGARQTLERDSLTLGGINRRPSEQSIGAVVDQLPAAGTQVQRGTAVQLWLSSGPVLREVPDVRGRDSGAAAQRLAASQFRLGEVFERAADTTPGSIVDQQPPAGSSARPGTAVRVWVAVAVPIEVPPVLGRRESEAAATLTGKRLRVGTIEVRESAQVRGTVTEQRPSPGQRVKPDTPVDLVLAKPIAVVVPDLRGQDTRAASAQLTSARLQLGETGEREVEGTSGLVVDQSPRPGERVDAGTLVQLWLAVPVRVAVPSLLGRTHAAAQALLEGRRLRPGAISTREASAAQGAVLAQRPPAGERVIVGTAVDLVLAVPIPVVVAPPATIPPAVNGLLEVPGTSVSISVPAAPPPPIVASADPAVPIPAPPAPATPWLWVLLGSLLGAAAAGFVGKARANLPRALPPSLTLAPHPDPKVAVTLSADGPLTRAELWLKPCPDAGVQVAQGGGPFGMIEVTESR